MGSSKMIAIYFCVRAVHGHPWKIDMTINDHWKLAKLNVGRIRRTRRSFRRSFPTSFLLVLAQKQS
jgi:hypothetical protein